MVQCLWSKPSIILWWAVPMRRVTGLWMCFACWFNQGSLCQPQKQQSERAFIFMQRRSLMRWKSWHERNQNGDYSIFPEDEDSTTDRTDMAALCFLACEIHSCVRWERTTCTGTQRTSNGRQWDGRGTDVMNKSSNHKAGKSKRLSSSASSSMPMKDQSIRFIHNDDKKQRRNQSSLDRIVQ
jgi:hypothetical protein